MRARLVERQIALAGVALLAGVAAIAVAANADDHRSTGPVPQGSYVALAGSSGPAAFGRRPACGTVLRPETEGVPHPTLPYGAKGFMTYGGKTIPPHAADHSPHPSDRHSRLTD